MMGAGGDPMPEEKPPAERAFRSFLSFGTGEGRPAKDSLARFYKHSYALSGTVPIKIRETFLGLFDGALAWPKGAKSRCTVPLAYLQHPPHTLL